ncbi:MAG: class I SAM-dependent methyltransferase [Halobacteriota archaeon]
MDRGTDFIMSDMFSLPFGSNSVSTSFNSGVFHHFEDGAIRQLTDKICRVTENHVVLSFSNEWYPKRRGETSLRMKTHEYWARLFAEHDALKLVEDGEYGNRLDALHRGVTEPLPLWLIRWLKAGLPYHRS